MAAAGKYRQKPKAAAVDNNFFIFSPFSVKKNGDIAIHKCASFEAFFAEPLLFFGLTLEGNF
jgi:hypothetical protein